MAASIADQFGLDAQERSQLIPSGKARTFDNRVGWSLTHLSQAGVVERPSRGVVSITDEGRAILARHPGRIGVRELNEYPSYREFRSRKKRAVEDDAQSDESSSEELTPSELAAQAVEINRAAVEGEVLKSAHELSPAGFENLVIRLLEKMGYGRAGSVERTSFSGDAGVDGIISQDPLGLDRIYVQAKRYAEERTIHRPRIHEFAGALLGKQGDRGVFITTSTFSAGAIAEAERINARIELIDGPRLAELLVAYGVGVQAEQTVTLYRLDEDFFESL